MMPSILVLLLFTFQEVLASIGQCIYKNGINSKTESFSPLFNVTIEYMWSKKF